MCDSAVDDRFDYSEDLFPCLTQSNDFKLRRSQRLIDLKTPTQHNKQNVESKSEQFQCNNASEASTTDFNMILEEVNWNTCLMALDLSKVKKETEAEIYQKIFPTQCKTNDSNKFSQKRKHYHVEKTQESADEKLKMDTNLHNDKSPKIPTTQHSVNDNMKNSNTEEVREIARKKPKIEGTAENVKNGLKVSYAQIENRTKSKQPQVSRKGMRVNTTKRKAAKQTKAETRGRRRKITTAVDKLKENEILPYANYVPPKVVRYNTCTAPAIAMANSFELPSTSQSLLPPVYPAHFTQQLMLVPNDQSESRYVPMPTTYPTPEYSQFIETKQSPATAADSLQDFFEAEEISDILNVDKILYRLTERHVRTLAVLLNKDIGELLSLLDMTIELDEADLKEISERAKIDVNTLRMDKVEAFQRRLILESTTTAETQFLPSQRLVK